MTKNKPGGIQVDEEEGAKKQFTELDAKLAEIADKLGVLDKLEVDLRAKIKEVEVKGIELKKAADGIPIKEEDDPNWKPKIFVSRYRSLRLVNPADYPRHIMTVGGAAEARYAPVAVFNNWVYIPKNKAEEVWILKHKSYKRDFWVEGDKAARVQVMTERVVDMVDASVVGKNPNINPVDLKVPAGTRTVVPGLIQGEVKVPGGFSD